MELNLTEEEITKYRDRLLSKTKIVDGCIEFTGSVQTGGYGQMGIKGRPYLTHKLAYEWLIGEVPSGLELDHICRNKKCLNTEHLEPVTHSENLIRRGLKGKKINKPERTHCRRGHRLTVENIYMRKNGVKQCQICRKMTRTH
jgi:hypothetical protein